MRKRILPAAGATFAAAVLAFGFAPAQAATDIGFHTTNNQLVLSVPAEAHGAQDIIPTEVGGWARTDVPEAEVSSVTVELTDATGATVSLDRVLTCDEARADCEWTAAIPFPLLPGPHTAKASMTDSAGGTGSVEIQIIVA